MKTRKDKINSYSTRVTPVYHILILVALVMFHVLQSYGSMGEQSLIPVTSKKDTINRSDRKGLRQGYWVLFTGTRKQAEFESASAQKVEEGSYLNDRRIGSWKKYFPSGRLRSLITFKNDIPNGLAKVYYENGNIMEEGFWEVDKWTGEYTRYHEDGSVHYKFFFNESGLRTGSQAYYYGNGQVMIEGSWEDGQESGLVLICNKGGSVREKKYFNNGSLTVSSTPLYSSHSIIYDPFSMIYDPDSMVHVASSRQNSDSKPGTPELDTSLKETGINTLYNLYHGGNRESAKKNYVLAMEAYNQALEIDENTDCVWFNIGNVQYELEDFQAALQAYSRCIEINSEYAEAYFGRALSNFQLGRPHGGCFDMKLAKRLGFSPAKDFIKLWCR